MDNQESNDIKVPAPARPLVLKVVGSPFFWWAIWFSLFLPWRLSVPGDWRFQLDQFRQGAAHLLPAFALLLQVFTAKKIWVKAVGAGLGIPVILTGLFLWLCDGFTPYVVDGQTRVGTHILERRHHWVFAQAPNNQLWEIIPVFPGLEVYRELGSGPNVEYKVIDNDTIELNDRSSKRTIKL